MIVLIDKTFEKDIKKIRDKKLISEILKQINLIKAATTIDGITGKKN